MSSPAPNFVEGFWDGFELMIQMMNYKYINVGSLLLVLFAIFITYAVLKFLKAGG